MSVPKHRTSRLQRKLESLHEKASHDERLVMEMLSVLYLGSYPEDIARCLRDANLRPTRGPSVFTPDRVRDLITSLDRSEMLDPDVEIPRLHPLLMEPAIRAAVRGGRFRAMMQAVERFAPGGRQHPHAPRQSFDLAMRAIRFALYDNQLPDLHALLQSCIRDFPEECAQAHPLTRIATAPFDTVWLRGLPTRMRMEILFTILNESVSNLTPAPEAFAFLESLARDKANPVLLSVLAVQYGLRGKTGKAGGIIESRDPAEATLLDAWLQTLRGEYRLAVELYESALRGLRSGEGRQKAFFSSVMGLFHILSLLASGDAADLAQAEHALSCLLRSAEGAHREAALFLQWLVYRLHGDITLPCPDATSLPGNSYTRLLRFLVLYWESQDALRGAAEELRAYFEQACRSGYDWFAGEAAALLIALEPEDLRVTAWEEAYRERSGTMPLLKVLSPRKPWERALGALLRVADTGGEAERAARVIWLLDQDSYGTWTLTAREQKATTRGNGWTRGRELTLRQLASDAETIPGLTPQDRTVCALIEGAKYGEAAVYSPALRVAYHLDPVKALSALVGHPHVYHAHAPEVPLEIVTGRPELRIEACADGYRIILAPYPGFLETMIQMETPTRVRVTPPYPLAGEMAEVIPPGGLLVPREAEATIQDVVQVFSTRLTIQSDVVHTDAQIEEVEGDPRIHVHLMPQGDALLVEMHVRPLEGRGTYYRPGEGAGHILVEDGGRHWRVTRNLTAEHREAEAVVGACAVLGRYEDVHLHWRLENPEDGLELLLSLQALGERVAVSWPKGGRFRVRQFQGGGGLNLRVRGSGEWLGVQGTLAVDEDRVIDFRTLLSLSASSTGRFIRIGEDEWLALTDEFRRRIEELEALGEWRGEELRLHGLVAPLLEDAGSWAASVEGDAGWGRMQKRLQTARAHTPVCPSTLQAELRPYQMEGFIWLARLAAWGVGACLADDMGLGKTVQALALILDRAPRGPTLVIAPTSVGWNWLREAARFAPTLRAVLYSESNRADLLANLQPYDLVICSYGLLQQDAEALAGPEWETLVLDEAQAIKNAATKRSKAAMALRGGFRMVTTGTPLENHLGELWNLFRFINPGLLGSRKQFQTRFAQPIERDHDPHARARLRTILQPFILRRRKSQVLEELPPRTDILQRVCPEPEEIAFYEALRREALAEVEKHAKDDSRALTVLAQIMRLRRACCNPRLVRPDVNVGSAKLAAFAGILDELLDNRHKCLVFSQFVDHLSILREHLDRKGIPYQYLDGSTPAKKRQTAVDAFQAGRGEVFLISLKAGGQGLNLTAADYVIHMDPWWNPAVEDQASDRAHRIGQTRPVTIYRLVMQGTIEEKIVDLHHQKRDLADSLLAGTETAARLDADALLALLREDVSS